MMKRALGTIAAVLSVCCAPMAQAVGPMQCDSDGSGTYNIRDLIALHRACLNDASAPGDEVVCDMNDDGDYTFGDLIAIHRECQSPPDLGDYCDPTANWPSDWSAYESELADRINAARAQGGNCGAYGQFPPSQPLQVHPSLTCSSRVHSLDMAERNYFDHYNPEGHGPNWRMAQAGYDGYGWGENIGAGYSSPAAMVSGWLSSDGHCANMLSSNFSEMGVGYAYGSNSTYGRYWTLNLGN